MNPAAELAGIVDSKAELISLFENSPVGLALCQSPGSVVSLNQSLGRMLGLQATSARPLSFPDLIHAQDRCEGEQLIAELFEGTRENFQIDSRTTGPNSRPVRWTAWRIAAEKGSPNQVVALAEDLPGLSAAEQRLHQAERLEAVGRLAGGVAHDFNNLLTGVLLYCDLLLASMEPLHRSRHYAEEIRKAGIQATGLVRQLLAVARPNNAQPRLLSLNDIADGMRNLLVRLIGENIDLTLRLDSNLGLIKMDPTQAQQILLNLVLNARDAMPQGGTIVVETCNCSIQVLAESPSASSSQTCLPCALFLVEDNGCGMDDSTRAHLFEPFFTTKAAKGNGLGLSTVHDIVTANGGLIHVDSELGRGTRVSVLLPLVPETAVPFCISKSSYLTRNTKPISSKKEE